VPRELLHSRNIQVNCYEIDGERLVVEGSLTDERFFPYVIHALNEKHDPGLMHQLALTMELSVPEMRIISIEAEMPVVPDPGCRDIRASVKKLAGRRIRAGFTNQVKELFGRGAGCLHLTNLILAMSSAAVQGLWSHLSRIRGGVTPPLPETDGSFFLNSCYMWREEGPFVEKFRELRRTNRKDEDDE
jgi:hypothetical protein